MLAANVPLAERTHCQRGHDLSRFGAIGIQKGRHYCRKCKNDIDRERQREKRAQRPCATCCKPVGRNVRPKSIWCPACDVGKPAKPRVRHVEREPNVIAILELTRELDRAMTPWDREAIRGQIRQLQGVG